MERIMFEYESQGAKNYVYTETEEVISKYQVKMMEMNEIYGLLPMHRTVFNGVHKLSYDITKQRRLKEVLLGRELSGSAAKKFMIDLLEALLGIEEYFLLYNRVVLDIEYIYLDAKGQIGMIYVPYQEKELLSSESVREFYKILLDYLADDNDGYSSSLLRYLNKQEFTIAGLLERLKDGSVAESAGAARYSAQTAQQSQPSPYQQQSPYSQPSPYVQPAEKAEPKEEKKKPMFGFDMKFKKEETAQGQNNDNGKESAKPMAEPAPKNENAGGFGFVVPGMENAGKPEKKESAPVKEKAEKKNLFGGLFGGKKEEASLSESQQPKNPQPKAPQPKVEPRQFPAPGPGTFYRDPKQEEWKGTVTLDEAKPSGTVMLGSDSGMAYLVHRGNRVMLSRFPFSIGRIPGMDYQINLPVISQKHVVISSKNGKYYVTDENSANHTYVNGSLIPPYTEVEIQSEDVLRLANEDVQFFA